MSKSRGRSLNLGDALILVAATAFGCYQLNWVELASEMEAVKITKAYLGYRWAFNTAVYPFWLPWTFALLAIRLRSSRPSFRRIARQPGLIASLLVSAAAPLFVTLSLLHYEWFGGHLKRWELGMPLPFAVLRALPSSFGLLVAGAWLTLALSGRWKAEASFIDRSGRLLGSGWIAFFVADEAERLFA